MSSCWPQPLGVPRLAFFYCELLGHGDGSMIALSTTVWRGVECNLARNQKQKKPTTEKLKVICNGNRLSPSWENKVDMLPELMTALDGPAPRKEVRFGEKCPWATLHWRASSPMDPEKGHPTSPQICSQKRRGGGFAGSRAFAIGFGPFAGSLQFVPSKPPRIGVTRSVGKHLLYCLCLQLKLPPRNPAL